MAATWTEHFIDGFDHQEAADVHKGYFSGSSGSAVVTANTRHNFGQGTKGITLTRSDGNHPTIRVCAAMKRASGTVENCIQFIADGAHQIIIRLTSSGDLEVWRGPGLGTLLGTASAVFPASSWLWVEVLVRIDDSAGTVIIFVSDTTTPVLSLVSQDTKNTASSYASSVTITGDSTLEWDDLHISYGTGTPVAGDALPDSRIVTCYSLTQGDHSDFTALSGTHVSQVRDDPTADEDTTYVYSNLAGDRESMHTDALPVDVDVINFVQVDAMVRKDDAAARTGTLFTRRNATDTDEAAPQNILDTYTFLHHCMAEDPETAAPWVRLDVDATQIGFELTS